MAKRKPAGRKATTRGTTASRARTTTRTGGKTARSAAPRRTSTSTAKKSATSRTAKASAGGRKTAKSAARGKTAGRKAATSRKTTGSRTTAAKRTGKTAAASAKRRSASSRGPKTATSARTATRPAGRSKTLPRRDTPARRRQIARDRRLIEETLPTPPSTLDLDRHPSAARSGRAELSEALGDHTATGPGITGGDVDADWESAYNTGDEAPGGDMPTPDQDVVEEIGSALGVQYADDEELKGADKIEQRDRHRWELDPASAEDYQDRSRQK